MATITGTNASDAELEGTNLADQIFGLGGNDILIGFDGDDELEGGKGADQLFGSLGFDTATYRNSAAGVVVFLDVSYAVGGEASGDTLFSIEGLRGSSFADSLAGHEQRNVLHGEGGNDEIEGRDGNDMLDGGAGHDALGGGRGDDELRGGTGNDLLEAGPGNDTLRGGSGNDTVLFSGAAVLVDLQAGSAFSPGEYGGTDSLFGIENVIGSQFGDLIGGNSGANMLDGALGGDIIQGGGGADRFIFSRTIESTLQQADYISDFNPAEHDRIDLSRIDANEQASGNQAFTFINQAQFTGVGQLRFFQADGRTYVEANTTDATPGAELRIILEDQVVPHVGDFLL